MPDRGSLPVKICGLKDEGAVSAAVEAGAAYLGFNFFPPSPRYAPPAEAASLAHAVPPGVIKVALVVDPDDASLDALLAAFPADMVQLHGAESPERVAAVKIRTGLPVMKALGIADAEDLKKIDHYSGAADQLLIDAKPPKGATLPGGNAVPFDWTLLEGRRWPLPWLLAGGLTPENVGQAIRRTGAAQVDVSSGVEATRGHKDPELIRAFIENAQAVRAPVLR